MSLHRDQLSSESIHRQLQHQTAQTYPWIPQENNWEEDPWTRAEREHAEQQEARAKAKAPPPTAPYAAPEPDAGPPVTPSIIPPRQHRVEQTPITRAFETLRQTAGSTVQSIPASRIVPPPPRPIQSAPIGVHYVHAHNHHPPILVGVPSQPKVASPKVPSLQLSPLLRPKPSCRPNIEVVDKEVVDFDSDSDMEVVECEDEDNGHQWANLLQKWELEKSKTLTELSWPESSCREEPEASEWRPSMLDGKVGVIIANVEEDIDQDTNEPVLKCADNRRLFALKEFAKITGRRVMMKVNLFNQDTIHEVRRILQNCDVTPGLTVRLRKHKGPKWNKKWSNLKQSMNRSRNRKRRRRW
eukprot:symbB.v1.2.038520.t1/scaffold6026.1/size31290/2